MATLEHANHPNERHTEKISGNNLPKRILTLATKCKRGREKRVQESALIQNSLAFDPQRSTDNTAREKQ